MKKFQKGLSAAVLLLLLCLAGCGVRETKQEGDRLQVVTTVFPYYDFTRQIAGEEVELTMVREWTAIPLNQLRQICA